MHNPTDPALLGAVRRFERAERTYHQIQARYDAAERRFDRAYDHLARTIEAVGIGNSDAVIVVHRGRAYVGRPIPQCDDRNLDIIPAVRVLAG